MTTRASFNPGDRVVYTAWNDPLEGVAGTVIEVSMEPHHSGVYSGVNYYLLVILDTAEEILDCHSRFRHEKDYTLEIPF